MREEKQKKYWSTVIQHNILRIGNNLNYEINPLKDKRILQPEDRKNHVRILYDAQNFYWIKHLRAR